MMAYIPCPGCGQPVDLQARTCEHCGVDLALAAVLAERRILLPEMLPKGLAVTPEALVPRLGDFLVEMGELSQEDLEQALAHQRQRAEAGKPVLIGQALRELDLVAPDVLDRAVTVQIMQYQLALSRANQDLQARVEARTQELAGAIEKLGELNQLKANFLANISHELRTPLTHIKGYLDIMAEGGLGPLTVEQRQAMKVMLGAETRLEKLIDDLIQFSLLSRGQVSLNLAHWEAARLVEAATRSARGKALNAGVELSVMIAPDLPEVLCDGDKIIWVIGQLVDNACKFTPRGGQVWVDVVEEDRGVRVSVEDSGIGIPAERMAEIFEPFHQLDSSSTRRYGGTGMGLAFSRRILAAHQVELMAHSRVGQGSTFSFKLPAAQRPVEEREPHV
ncbi:MAG: ATP-binding protein [Chloroflexi bacterium]|nr:ATP-binding protein [Chloroflexota bacterium]